MVGTGSYQTIWDPPLSNVTRHSGWWPSTVTPSIDQALHQCLTNVWTLLPNLTFCRIVRGVHRTFATGAACEQRTLTPPDTLSCPTFGLASGLMLRPISPELVLFPDVWDSNIRRYFLFAYTWKVLLQQWFLVNLQWSRLVIYDKCVMTTQLKLVFRCDCRQYNYFKEIIG